MTDEELIAATHPPAPLAKALLACDEKGMEQLLSLLFACHKLVCGDEEDQLGWPSGDLAWPLRRQYQANTLTPALAEIAPTWPDAIRLSEEWFRQWPHDCSDEGCWSERRDELDDPTALGVLRKIMRERHEISLMNTIEITVTATPTTGADGQARTEIELLLTIDGKPCPEFDDLPIEPAALIASGHKVGEFFIATCGCGESQCAGVTNGVEVGHCGLGLVWRVPIPYVKKQSNQSAAADFKEYHFHGYDYRTKINALRGELKKFAEREAQGERFEITSHPGTRMSDLLELIDKGLDGW